MGVLVEGVEVRPDDLIYPFPRPLCMGCSWSLYFAQAANESLMSSVNSLSMSRLINDRSDPLVVKGSEAGSQTQLAGDYHYVYVDSLGIMSTNREHVAGSLTEVEHLFNGRNLSLHPGEVLSDRADVLGCRLDLKEHCTCVKPDTNRCESGRPWRASSHSATSLAGSSRYS